MFTKPTQSEKAAARKLYSGMSAQQIAATVDRKQLKSLSPEKIIKIAQNIAGDNPGNLVHFLQFKDELRQKSIDDQETIYSAILQQYIGDFQKTVTSGCSRAKPRERLSFLQNLDKIETLLAQFPSLKGGRSYQIQSNFQQQITKSRQTALADLNKDILQMQKNQQLAKEGISLRSKIFIAALIVVVVLMVINFPLGLISTTAVSLMVAATFGATLLSTFKDIFSKPKFSASDATLLSECQNYKHSPVTLMPLQPEKPDQGTVLDCYKSPIQPPATNSNNKRHEQPTISNTPETPAEDPIPPANLYQSKLS